MRSSQRIKYHLIWRIFDLLNYLMSILGFLNPKWEFNLKNAFLRVLHIFRCFHSFTLSLEASTFFLCFDSNLETLNFISFQEESLLAHPRSFLPIAHSSYGNNNRYFMFDEKNIIYEISSWINLFHNQNLHLHIKSNVIESE